MKQFLPFLLVLFLILPTNATTTKGSVVFLLDFSGSMAENDPDKQGLEGVKQLISSIPPQYQVGIVAYHQDIAIEIPLLDLTSLETLDFLTDPLDRAEYGGYSNAGLGLSTAMGFFSQEEGEKQIIMICDGEILLPNSADTKASQILFQDAVAEGVRQGVSLHLIALGDLEDTLIREELRYLTGDFYPVDQNFHAIWTQILQDHLQRPLIELDSHRSSSRQQEWRLPLDSLTLLLQSDIPMEGFSLVSGGTILAEGDYFRLISTTETTLTYEIATESPSELRLFAWGEMAVYPEIDYYYDDTLLEDGSGYHRQVRGKIRFYTPDGTQAFTEELFQNHPVTVWTEGKEETYLLENGVLSLSTFDTSPQELYFSLEESPISVEISPLTLSPEPPPLPPEKAAPSPWLTFWGGALFGGFLLWLGLKKETSSPKKKARKYKNAPQKKSPKVNYAYVGTLQLELTQGRVDFPVKSYSLFRVPQHRPISLEEILAVCFDFSTVLGTEKILFRPYRDKMISLTNESTGTIQLDQRILRKNQTHHLPIGARLDLLLEDGSVLVIIYNLP